MHSIYVFKILNTKAERENRKCCKTRNEKIITLVSNDNQLLKQLEGR